MPATCSYTRCITVFPLDSFQLLAHSFLLRFREEHRHLIGEQCRTSEKQRACLLFRRKADGRKQIHQSPASQKKILFPVVVTSDTNDTFMHDERFN